VAKWSSASWIPRCEANCFQVSSVLRPNLLLLGLLIPAGLRADDWPQWRGPNRDGAWTESGILETFPAEGPKIRWRMPIGLG